jgi:hypothetical protein
MAHSFQSMHQALARQLTTLIRISSCIVSQPIGVIILLFLICIFLISICDWEWTSGER